MPVNSGQTNFKLRCPYLTTKVHMYDQHKHQGSTGQKHKLHNSRKRLHSAKFTIYYPTIHLRYLVRTTHNSMQVTTSHYEGHKWHNTCWKDLPGFLETRTHHPKKCSRYAYMWGVKQTKTISDVRAEDSA